MNSICSIKKGQTKCSLSLINANLHLDSFSVYSLLRDFSFLFFFVRVIIRILILFPFFYRFLWFSFLPYHFYHHFLLNHSNSVLRPVIRWSCPFMRVSISVRMFVCVCIALHIVIRDQKDNNKVHLSLSFSLFFLSFALCLSCFPLFSSLSSLVFFLSFELLRFFFLLRYLFCLVLSFFIHYGQAFIYLVNNIILQYWITF